MRFALMLALYAVPAAILFSATLAVALLAVLFWLVFVARILLAVKRPSSNRPAAYGTIGLGAAIALAAALFMPPLPQ